MSAPRRYKRDSGGRWRDERGRFANKQAVEGQRRRRRREREERSEREEAAERQRRHREKVRAVEEESEKERRDRKAEEIISAPEPMGPDWIEILPKEEQIHLRLRLAELEGRFDEEARKIAIEEGMTPHDVYTLYLSPDAAA